MLYLKRWMLETIGKSSQAQPSQAQQLKPIPANHQTSSTALCDKDRAREEKRKGKQVMTSPSGPGLYNSFSALGSLGEEG